MIDGRVSQIGEVFWSPTEITDGRWVDGWVSANSTNFWSQARQISNGRESVDLKKFWSQTRENVNG
jgi:hypothetical protein